MHNSDIVYLTEDPSHDGIIQLINQEAFGPGRFTRAAERVREQGPHDRRLSFVASENGAIVGSVRLTPVLAGGVKAHLLGPLAVRPTHKNRGIGRALVAISVGRALDQGSEGVILVGDPPYYQPLGFEPVAIGTLAFPGPVDPSRILIAGCSPTARVKLKGTVDWRA
ncbi:GNAT family N-acetyltransferase [Georhizobium sp. MAB10]|uniref:GNAT family N-acetyltransferase n=1 Tax=Georhizobium sp. MAB10 TaxID=3028319 RepID=UPI003855F336